MLMSRCNGIANDLVTEDFLGIINGEIRSILKTMHLLNGDDGVIAIKNIFQYIRDNRVYIFVLAHTTDGDYFVYCPQLCLIQGINVPIGSPVPMSSLSAIAGDINYVTVMTLTLLRDIYTDRVKDMNRADHSSHFYSDEMKPIGVIFFMVPQFGLHSLAFFVDEESRCMFVTDGDLCILLTIDVEA